MKLDIYQFDKTKLERPTQMSATDETLDVILRIGEGKAPLVGGKEIRGRVTAMLPLSWSPPDRGAVIQPEEDTRIHYQGLTLFVSRRLNTETWVDFKAGKPITVNVSLFTAQNHEVAAGIGTLSRLNQGSGEPYHAT